MFPSVAGWTEAYDAEGRRYYLNNYERTTTWERPTEAAGAMATAASPLTAAPGGSKSPRRQSALSAGNADRTHLPTRTARRSR
ncbi:unnamed protein product [Hapterophycus canaliculatus]